MSSGVYQHGSQSRQDNNIKKDEYIVMAALKKNINNLYYASEDLKSNKDLILYAV